MPSFFTRGRSAKAAKDYEKKQSGSLTRPHTLHGDRPPAQGSMLPTKNMFIARAIKPVDAKKLATLAGGPISHLQIPQQSTELNKKNRRLTKNLTAIFTSRAHSSSPDLQMDLPLSPSSAYSVETDIRSPSGLGRRASDDSIGGSFVDDEGTYRPRSHSPECPDIRRPSGLGRRRSEKRYNERRNSIPSSIASSPAPRTSKTSPSSPHNLTRWSTTPRRPSSVDLSVTTRAPSAHLRTVHVDHIFFSHLPTDILADSIFALLPKSDLPAVARVSRVFCDAAREVLYRDLDLGTLTYLRVGLCVAVLASNQDLAALVRSFSCPLLASSFPVALRNMYQLTSLSLRRYDHAVLDNTSFRLRSLAFTDPLRAEEAECAAFTSWLKTAQPDLRSLSLPATPALPTPFPTSILPRLSHFHGAMTFAAAIVPNRPVSHVAIRISTSLYDGLRPSDLMGSLAQSSDPVTHLELSLDPRVDARTHECILVAAGKQLPSLQTLDITWLLDPKELYKQITFVLGLFPVLNTLRLKWDTQSLGKPTYDCESEVNQLQAWHRQSTALRNVSLLSGTEWFIHPDGCDFSLVVN